jgi:hypothetical protein
MKKEKNLGEQPEKKLPSPKRKLKPGMGKSKGSGFEGLIAKKLSAALAPLTFIRSPGSGARVGGKNFETFGKMFGADAMKLFVADVVATNEKEAGVEFRYSVECKSYQKSDSLEAHVSGTANIFKWMQESVVDAAKTGKLPMLICKWNHTPVYVCVLSKDVYQFNVRPKMVLNAQDQSIDVYYFDDLAGNSLFWCSNGL